MEMICVTDLHKSFDGTPVLKGVYMCVKKGSIYGLLGKNGAGKTTLIKHLTGIYLQDSGQVTLEGEPVYENSSMKSKIFCMFDEPYAFPTYTIEGMAKFYQRIYPSWNGKRYQDMLEDFQLNEKYRWNRLSKGMKKQAAFLLAMSAMPEYLIMDEPVDGIDPIFRKKIWNWIIDDVGQREMTVLVSSHNLRELEGICDAVAILKDGLVTLESDIDQMKNTHYKVQLALKDQDMALPEELDILHRDVLGTIQLLVVKGSEKEITEILQKLDPVRLDLLPLTLEEIFVYTLGGDDRE